MARTPLFLVGAAFVILAVVLNAFVLWGIRSPERKWHATGCHRARLLMISMFAGSVLVMMSYQPFLEWMRAFLEWMREILISPSVDAPPPDLGYLGWLNIEYHMLCIGLVVFMISLLTFVPLLFKWFLNDPFAVELGLLNIARLPGAAVGSGVTTGVMIALVEELLRPMILDEKPWLRAMTGPPLLLLAVVVGIVVQVALLGRVGSESEREW